MFAEGKEYMAGQGTRRRNQRAYQVNGIQITQLWVIGCYRDQRSDRSDDDKQKNADSNLRDPEG